MICGIVRAAITSSLLKKGQDRVRVKEGTHGNTEEVVHDHQECEMISYVQVHRPIIEI